MTRVAQGPLAWSGYINQVLDQAFGLERYPVSVVETAPLLSARLFPDDPLTWIHGEPLQGLDGILAPDPRHRKGWAIFFNSAVQSRRRIRFTLGHEFGHYLMHRTNHQQGFQCVDREMFATRRGNLRLEQEADIFSAHFLMPMEDFQRQIAPGEFTDLATLSLCADRYGVSLQAVIRQWLRYTTRQALLVLSRDGFILWSETSRSARRFRRFLRNHQAPVAIPATSLAACPGSIPYPREGTALPKGTWFPDTETVEMVVISRQYDCIISLLHLDVEDIGSGET
ncbi:MAG: ImmA/IrrE family metallo-endopeptidase [Magnetococcus sp. DMHC-1]|nr:ImmA/IrrE family metallo-endopeptidase [Magnetococcales bacterium]